ncbi:MAG: hypothetical protein AB1452_02680 [Pseudomonadota bacterium]
MSDLTLTELRKRLFRVADKVLATGAPVRIRRGTRLLTLSADSRRRAASRLARLKRRDVITGEAKDLWKVRPGRWRGRASAA